MSSCKKCDNSGTILLRKRDLYCSVCFVTNVNHKFRASIGKTRILSPNERVLICLSGGLASTVLLDLVHNGVTLTNHKKLWITPVFIHVLDLMDNDDDDDMIAKSIVEQCKNHKFDIHLCRISDYILKTKNISNINEICQKDVIAETQLKNLLNNMPSSTRNDYLIKIKRELFIWYAEELNCSHIFTAETTSTLAVNLISNLTLGRGSQVQHDVGFCDSRNQVKILRPMKDITQEELQHYIQISKLAPVKLKVNQENSLQSVIQIFIDDLQENFQSTISTVCKTAEKIGSQDENEHNMKCILCESGITEAEAKLSALEATNYSRTVNQTDNTEKISLSMFPHVNKHLCYACSKNYLEMDPKTVPIRINQLLSSNSQ